MSTIKLQTPLRDISVNQPFGVNYVDFYQKLGMTGHNGLDFKAQDGCPCYAANDGIVTVAGEDSQGGRQVVIWDRVNNFITIYYHLADWTVSVNDDVKTGDLIGYTDNTGIYTTGGHLHFGLKFVNNKGNTLNKSNGTLGAVDPSSYFPRGWDVTPVNKFYGKKRNWLAEFYIRFAPVKVENTWVKSGHWIQKQLWKYGVKVLSGEQTNALVYGSWDFESVMNPALYEQWGYMTKEEFLSGQRSFNR